MQLDLSFFPNTRAADERMLEILALADSGMRFDHIDLKFGLPAGAAMKTWFDIREACGDLIAAH